MWAKKLFKAARKRSAYQDQQAEGLITLDELRSKLASLVEVRSVALKELEALRSHREQKERLERDAYALLEHYAGAVPETLDSLTFKERHSIYKMPRLRVVVFADEPVEITGMFGGPLEAHTSCFVKSEAMRAAIPVDERRPSLVLVPRYPGDVHVYRHGQCSVTISAAGGLEALEFVQCLVETALDRSLVAGELGKSVRFIRVSDEGQA